VRPNAQRGAEHQGRQDEADRAMKLLSILYPHLDITVKHQPAEKPPTELQIEQDNERERRVNLLEKRLGICGIAMDPETKKLLLKRARSYDLRAEWSEEQEEEDELGLL
jgi:hypothetical protein